MKEARELESTTAVVVRSSVLAMVVEAGGRWATTFKKVGHSGRYVPHREAQQHIFFFSPAGTHIEVRKDTRYVRVNHAIRDNLHAPKENSNEQQQNTTPHTKKIMFVESVESPFFSIERWIVDCRSTDAWNTAHQLIGKRTLSLHPCTCLEGC